MVKRRASRQINNKKNRKAGAIESAGLWEKAFDVETEAIKEILDVVDFIAAACVDARDPVLDDRQFRACVIDEATHATEPATLIPILSGVDTVALVGDPAQFPPTVISRDALEEGLSKSLLSIYRSVDSSLFFWIPNTGCTLASWPSQMFYGTRLLSHFKPSEMPIPKGLEWPNEANPLVFIECANGVEQITAFGNSWFNRPEAL